MKKALLLFIFSISTFSATFLPISKLGKDTTGISLQSSKAKCESLSGEECLNISETGNYPYLELQEFQEVEENSVSCLTGCDEAFEALECEEGFEKRKGMISVYCYKAILEKVVVDETKKAAYDAAQAVKEQDAAAMALVMANMECGKKAVARMTLINSTKSFDEAQVASFVSTYSDIKQLLETGALGTAIQAIQAVTADGTIVTEADKTALVDQIYSCKQ